MLMFLKWVMLIDAIAMVIICILQSKTSSQITDVFRSQNDIALFSTVKKHGYYHVLNRAMGVCTAIFMIGACAIQVIG